ncbi:MAG: ABC transporter ATP-binding protein, partial [Lancefieldella parvula]
MSKATETNIARPKLPVGKILTRTIKMLWEFYPVLLPIALLGAVIQAIMQSLPSVFLERILSIISNFIDTGDWSSAEGLVFQNVTLLATFYVIGLLANIISTQGMAIITQGALQKWRSKMFSHMQDLPIRYFDTHLNGDIMSYYTNDIDAMRQMIGTSLPNLLFTFVVIIAVVFIMFYYSALMALVVLFSVSLMALTTKNLGGKSAKNFVKTQKTTADVEGHIQEMMNGEKVVKVFSHEAETIESFDKINDDLMIVARNANLYANTLMPILNNLGNIMYVIVAIVSGVFIALNIQNVSLSGLPFTIAVAVPFLNMTRQFSA